MEIVERLRTIDQRHPTEDQDYIERIARDAAKYADSFKTCPHPVLKRYCQVDQAPCLGGAAAAMSAMPPEQLEGRLWIVVEKTRRIRGSGDSS